MTKQKNKYIAFHGNNQAAVQVYRDLKQIAHERDLFIWQVIQLALMSLQESEEARRLILAVKENPNTQLTQAEIETIQRAIGENWRIVSRPQNGWAGVDPDEFLRGNGYRTELDQTAKKEME